MHNFISAFQSYGAKHHHLHLQVREVRLRQDWSHGWEEAGSGFKTRFCRQQFPLPSVDPEEFLEIVLSNGCQHWLHSRVIWGVEHEDFLGLMQLVRTSGGPGPLSPTGLVQLPRFSEDSEAQHFFQVGQLVSYKQGLDPRSSDCPFVSSYCSISKS